ncbi:MAG: hypothetical protein LBC74_03275 [Planctomycetaceae bacterium]|nr:hypothetical protein [Planctomycetaceae bacterium]
MRHAIYCTSGILDLFSNLKIHQRNKKPPLTPPRPPLTPPKDGNKKTPPREANYSHPSEGSGVVSYWLAKGLLGLAIILRLMIQKGL